MRSLIDNWCWLRADPMDASGIVSIVVTILAVLVAFVCVYSKGWLKSILTAKNKLDPKQYHNFTVIKRREVTSDAARKTLFLTLAYLALKTSRVGRT